MSIVRGSIWFAELPGIGDKPVVVVSAESLNRALKNVIVARVTSVKRRRSLPTFVEIEKSDDKGLKEKSFVICHDLHTIPKTTLRRKVGMLSAVKTLEIDGALGSALALQSR